MYSTHILNHPKATADYRSKQSEQASYYEKIIRNIDIILQMIRYVTSMKVYLRYHHPGMYHQEMNWKMIISEFILQSAQGDADITDKETWIIHMEFIRERDSKVNCPDSHSRQ